VAQQITSLIDQPWITAMVRSSALDDTLSALHPMLSLSQVRARVVRILNETADTKTFVLQPNAQWQGAQSGQFVRLQCEINGRKVERVYSLSSKGGARRLAITVKRQPLGLMSEHLHHQVKVGDVLSISQAAGEFTLPATLPQKILLLSAGSGITPVMAMLRDLQAQQYAGDVLFVHSCSNAEARIFAAHIDGIQADWPQLRVITHYSQTQGRLDTSTLQQVVPDLSERSTWMCGPAVWMDSIHDLWSEQHFPAALQSERFGGAPLRIAAPGAPVAVACESSGVTFHTPDAQNLLLQAERAGLKPKHGCRIGICRSCQCVKRSGTVENLLTGEVSSTPNELIRICISSARSDVALDL
jgi:ferredoxin-NADP reductase